MPLPRLCAPDRPDWRWERVVELSRYSATQADARLLREDAKVRRAYRFKRFYDRGIVDQEEFEDIEAAHHTWLNQRDNRILLECFLVTGAETDRIADRMWMAPALVDAYHDVFFCVRPALARHGWIQGAVLGNYSAASHHLGDAHGTALRMAYLAGPDVFEEMLGSNSFGEADMLQSLSRIARGMVMISATEQALSGSIAREQVPELLRISMDISEATKGKRGGADDIAGRTAEFMKSLGVSVADPTDKRNLELPAREEREADYEVANHG